MTRFVRKLSIITNIGLTRRVNIKWKFISLGATVKQEGKKEPLLNLHPRYRTMFEEQSETSYGG
jgi:hypothetical protein